MARYRRSYWQRVLTLAVFAAIVLLRLWSERDPLGGDRESNVNTGRESGADSTVLETGAVQVIRVVDGDTLILGKRNRRVRLQGVDTPETVKDGAPVEAWGPEATRFTQQFVEQAGGVLRVEVDGEAQDRYGRYLAFLWHESRMLNEELVRAGLARAKLGYDYSQAKKNRLKQAEREAQRARQGIWSEP